MRWVALMLVAMVVAGCSSGGEGRPASAPASPPVSVMPEPVSAAEAHRLLEARCSAAEVAPPSSCDDNTVRWLVDTVPPPWQLTDPLNLSNHQVWGHEPTAEERARVLEGVAAGQPFSEIRSRYLPAALHGPYRSPDEALRIYMSSCHAEPCITGYVINSRDGGRARGSVVRQPDIRSGTAPFGETIYVSVVVEELPDLGWWVTEVGPTGVHNNQSAADADGRMQTCCDVVWTHAAED